MSPTITRNNVTLRLSGDYPCVNCGLQTYDGVRDALGNLILPITDSVRRYCATCDITTHHFRTAWAEPT
jgi:hypothetical protein